MPSEHSTLGHLVHSRHFSSLCSCRDFEPVRNPLRRALDSAHPQIKILMVGTSVNFQSRNEGLFARSRKLRDCAETYMGTSHKESRRLTPRLRKTAISGW
jgi:hypothetical protein